MFLGALQQRHKVADLMKEVLNADVPQKIKDAMQGWLDNFKDPEGSRKYGDQLKSLFSAQDDNTLLAEIAAYSKLFTKKSYWVFVGDGAAYDIGFGGIDHVLATGEDINILVMDTEVYSNTGGQASTASFKGQDAKMAKDWAKADAIREQLNSLGIIVKDTKDGATWERG